MTLRAPHLYRALRCFCLVAFAELGATEPEYSVDERGGFCQYRPLVGEQIDAAAERLAALPDAQIAAGELRRERASAIFGQSMLRSLLLPLLAATAEGAGGFDWSDAAFDRAYADLEETLYGDRRYVAVAPLLGLTVREELDLGAGIRARPGPELVLERELPAAQTRLPDAPGELADAVTALRLATGGPVAVGPLLQERIQRIQADRRAVLTVAATVPPGEPTLLDRFRGRLARDLLERLVAAEADAELSEALERWELSLFQAEPLCSEQRREALAVLLGGGDGLFAATARTAVLLGETPQDRAALFARLRDAAPDGDVLRRALVEVVMHGDRERLIERLDESLLGLRPRPPGYFSASAVAS